MKKGDGVAFVVGALGAGQALALGSLVASYPGPGAYGNVGIGYINQNYMVVATDTPGYVYRLWRTTGSTASSYPAPNRPLACDFGLVGTTGYNFVVVGYTVFLMDWISGSIYGSWSTPENEICRGIAFVASGGGNYVMLTASSMHFYLCDWATGSVYQTFQEWFIPSDIGYDPNRDCFWVGDVLYNYVRRLNFYGVPVASFTVPYPPAGLGYEPGRNYVWVGRNDANNNYIYLYETSSTTVTPASMGKVKAIFR